MATLVLAAVGTAIGGPIGGAVGGLLGGAVDGALLAPGPRAGPRLTELKLQTSSYGTPIPLVFGTLRVAGTVIWATDLTEQRERQGGGKGQPGVTRYSYHASFAVALSGRPIRGVRRIWAEGKLLRGAAGDWKTEIGEFRLHRGGEDQPADPLIVAREGWAAVPAHRGVAYAVFEDLALADFGNRIPSLTFEVEADAGAVAAGAVLAEATGGAVADGGATLRLGGYAAWGSAAALAEQIAGVAGAGLAPAGDGLRLAGPGAPVAALADLGIAAGERGAATGQRRIGGADGAPERVVVAHHDPARDWQTGSQSAGRAGTGGGEQRIELPAALEAGAAKALAADLLARAGAERVRRTVAPGWAALGVRPGDTVRLAGEAGDWRVRSWTLERMAPVLELVPVAIPAVPQAAAPGRVAGAEDRVHGPTVLAVFEVPGWPDAPLDRPRLLVAAAGPPGWRRAALLMSGDGGASWREAGGTAAPAVMGVVTVPAGAGDAALVDRRAAIEVELLHGEMVLAGATAARVDAGANLALIGDELVQFESAEPLGGRRWRLGGLWRGRRATVAAAGAAGDRFVLLEPATLVAIDLDPAQRGGAVRMLASGPGDPVPAAADVAVRGAALVPPAPVLLRARREGAGVRLGWVRRGRTGWRWLDGGDVPLGEEREAYRVTVTDADGAERVWETAATSVLLPADAAGGTARVRQIGSFAESLPSAAINLGEDG